METVHVLQPTPLEFLDELILPCGAGDRSSQETNYAIQDRVEPERREAWFGGVTLEEALALNKIGWHEGAKQVSEMSAHISAPLFAQVEKLAAFDVAPGEWLDQDRFLSGQPDVWGEIQDSEELVTGARGKYVHIMVNGGLACSQCDSMNCMTEPVHPRTLLNRGAMICSLADILENLNFRVKISLVYCICSIADNGKQKLAFGWPLKDYHQHLDMESLMYSVGHPSALRRLAFAYLEHLPPDMIRDFKIFNNGAQPGHYGMLSDVIPEELGLTDERDSIITIPFVKGNPPSFSSPAAARKYCCDILQKQGVRIQPLD